MDRQRSRLLIVFLVALAARLVLFCVGPLQDRSRVMAEDSHVYHDLADNLVRYGTFGLHAAHRSGMQVVLDRLASRGRNQELLIPESFRTPGYPAFVAAVSLGMREILLVPLTQCVLGALGAVMLVIIATRVGVNPTPAVAAGLAWALHPALVTFDNLLLTESTFVFATVAAYFAATSRNAARGVFVGGILLGFATLIRPPLGLVFVPGLIALAWPLVPSRRALGAAALLACAPAALWALRNSSVGEGFRISTIAEINLVFYAAPCAISEVLGEDCDSSYPRRWAELEGRARGQIRLGDDALAVVRGNALDDLRTHLGGALRMYAKSVLKLGIGHSLGLTSRTVGRSYESSGLLAALVLREPSRTRSTSIGSLVVPLAWILANVLILALALVGLCRLAWRRAWRLLVAFGLSASACVLTVGAVGQERIRLPMMISLLVLSGIALSRGEHMFQQVGAAPSWRTRKPEASD